MNFGSIFQQLFGTGGGPQGEQGAQGGSALADALARSFYESNQGGVTDGSGMTDMARLYDSSRAAPAAADPAQPAAGPQGVSPSTMQLIAPPQAGNFNITNAQGSKAKNYRPASMTMDVPGPSALAALGLLPQRNTPFQITAPQGYKAKNYKPAQMVVNAPSAVGPSGMMQVLAMMNQQSPFGTNGRG